MTEAIEVKKIGYRQAKDGFVLSIVIHPNEQHDAIAVAPIGTRFAMALVEIADDETAVEKPPTYQEMRGIFKEPKERQSWGELTPTAQACIRCQEPVFQQYVVEKRGFDELPNDREKNAAVFIRRQCNVNTRGALSTNKAGAAIWRSIDNDFLGWKHAESM